MAVATLLDRLDRVREIGPGRWLALCPAHDDRHPSLSIRETDKGLILLKCWSGCQATDIIASVGMRMSDLFPEPLAHSVSAPRDRKHSHSAIQALKSIDDAALLIMVAAENIAAGEILTPEELEQVAHAAAEINQARKAVA